MHVLITSDTMNGIWTYTRELTCGLIARGYRVTLVSFGEIPLPEQTAWMEPLPDLHYACLNDGLAFHRGFILGIFAQVAKFARLLDLFRQSEVKLVFELVEFSPQFGFYVFHLSIIA